MISLAVSLCSLGVLLQPLELVIDSIVALSRPESSVNWQKLTDDAKDGSLSEELGDDWTLLQSESMIVLVDRKLLDFKQLAAQAAFCLALNSSDSATSGLISLSSLDPHSRKEFTNYLKNVQPIWGALFDKPNLELLVRPNVELELDSNTGSSWMHFDVPNRTSDPPDYSGTYKGTNEEAQAVRENLKESGSVEVFPWALQTRVLKATSRRYGELIASAIQIAESEFLVFANQIRELTERFVESQIGKSDKELALGIRTGGDLNGFMFQRAVNAVDNNRDHLGLSDDQDAEAWFRKAKVRSSSFRLFVKFQITDDAGRTMVYSFGLPKSTGN